MGEGDRSPSNIDALRYTQIVAKARALAFRNAPDTAFSIPDLSFGLLCMAKEFKIPDSSISHLNNGIDGEIFDLRERLDRLYNGWLVAKWRKRC